MITTLCLPLLMLRLCIAGFRKQYRSESSLILSDERERFHNVDIQPPFHQMELAQGAIVAMQTASEGITS